MASMDVSALNPSLEKTESVRIEFISSGLENEGVDWRYVALYLAVTVDKDELTREGIEHLVARRRRVRGRKPTVGCLKLAGGMRRQERKDVEQDPDLLEAWEQEDDMTIGGRLDLEMWDNKPKGH